MNCLDESTLSSYLDKKLSVDERGKIEEHISRCNHCLDMLLVAYEADKSGNKIIGLQRLNNKVNARLGILPDIKRNNRKSSSLKWLFGAVILFALSFAVKRFFLQFLTASAVLGFKWVMEGEGAKKAVLIFRDIRKDKEDERMSFLRKKSGHFSE